MTDLPVPADPVGAADAFAAEAASALAFLDSPPPMPTGSLDVLRGDRRLFDPIQRVAANEPARVEAGAGDAVAAAGTGAPGPEPFPSPLPEVADVSGMFGLDLGAMTPEQLMQLMMGCAAQMMRRMARAAEAGAPFPR